MYCIDASVLTAIFDESDSFHQTSLELFEFITKTDHQRQSAKGTRQCHDRSNDAGRGVALDPRMTATVSSLL